MRWNSSSCSMEKKSTATREHTTSKVRMISSRWTAKASGVASGVRCCTSAERYWYGMNDTTLATKNSAASRLAAEYGASCQRTEERAGLDSDGLSAGSCGGGGGLAGAR